MSRLAKLVLAGALPALLLSACDTPRVAGNTFRTGTERPVGVNVSYDFDYVDRTSYTVADKLTADVWLFEDRQHSVPGAWLQLHHVDEIQEYDTGPGDVVNLGRRRFKSQTFCVPWSGEGVAGIEHGDEIAPYLAFMQGNAEASRYVMIRRFIPQVREADLDRVDVVYIEDLVRYGFDCAPFADVRAPQGEAAVDYMNQFKIRSLRAFEVAA